MFHPNSFVVGKPVRTVDFDWYLPATNSWKRTAIPGKEILDSFAATKQYATLEEAMQIAEDNAKKHEPLEVESSGCAFMKVECPVFEINGEKILYVHFQGNKFCRSNLENLNKPAKSSCTIS